MQMTKNDPDAREQFDLLRDMAHMAGNNWNPNRSVPLRITIRRITLRIVRQLIITRHCTGGLHNIELYDEHANAGVTGSRDTVRAGALNYLIPRSDNEEYVLEESMIQPADLRVTEG
jgi:hypothetical protein